jgi:hypothetical protein
MANVDLAYDPSSLCGPVDLRVARFLEKYRGNKLDPSYLRHVQQWHGGIPSKQYFEAEDGKTYRVGRCLTLVDEKTKLKPPTRPSWKFRERDIRIDWSILTLIDEEGPSCRNLFGGEQLLPFAALHRGQLHPDKMGLTDGDCDLACFFYTSKTKRPRIVVWHADLAQKEHWRWDEALKASGWNKEERVRYEDFTVPVAADFDEFIAKLRVESRVEKPSRTRSSK